MLQQRGILCYIILYTMYITMEKNLTLAEEQKEFLLLFRLARPAKRNVLRNYSRETGIAAATTYLSRKGK